MASASDNFNRSDGEIGANWTEDVGDIDIVSNQADAQTAGDFNRARYTATAMDSADHYSQALVFNGYVSARQASSTFTCYGGSFAGAWSNYDLVKMISGSETSLDSVATGAESSATLKLEVNGSAQELFADTVSKCTASDTAITSGIYCGMFIYGADGLWDDWEAADLSAAAIAPTAVIYGPLVGPFGGPI
jgi:hypothetical protein